LPIVGDRDTACQQDARSERVEGEEGRSFEREDASILPCDSNRHAPEDQLRPNGIGRSQAWIARNESVESSDVRWLLATQPCAADECECERDEGDSSCSQPAHPLASHQISDGDAGHENGSDEESEKGQVLRIHRHDVDS